MDEASSDKVSALVNAICSSTAAINAARAHHIHAGQTHDLALFQPDLVHTVIVLSGDLLDVIPCVPSLLCSAWGL